MKLSKYIVLTYVALGLSSCTDWLDVNLNPDQPNSASILVQNRAPWVLKQYTYSAGCANTRTFATAGGFYSTNGNMNAVSVTWTGAAGLTTTPYQTWFVGAASNVVDLYDKAESEGAYHYMALANVIHALGFMEMLDLYGEIPYEHALAKYPGQNPAPEYSNGKEIYEGCMKKIDEAIVLFGKDQEPGCEPLSAGDIWNGGDVDKWIKLCYGLKARWMLKLSKKAEFNPDAILECLEKAPQSLNDDTKMACYDVNGDQTDFLLGDPIYTNGNWDTAAYGKTQWFSEFYYNLLANMRDANIEDPRLSKIVPASMTSMILTSTGKVSDYKWRRGKGVDIFGEAERLVSGGEASIIAQTFATLDNFKNNKTLIKYTFKEGQEQEKNEFYDNFVRQGYKESDSTSIDKIGGREIKKDGNVVAVRYPAGSWFINSNNYVCAGDTAYVNLNGASVNTNNGSWGIDAKDNYYFSNDRAGATAGAVSGTGSFQIRAMSDFDILTYYEMCFIKAEVLFRKGDAAGALEAYKAGIRANIDRMQKKLSQWKGEGYTNPDMWPMDETAINTYMNSDAVCQSAGQLTMSDIMLQKYVAMGWSIENYNDMRRFNFSAGNIESFGVVYPGYGRTKLFAGASALTGTSPDDPTYWIRRWRLPATLELSYNGDNALAANAKAFNNNIWCIPVWWDCATDAEYENYLK